MSEGPKRRWFQFSLRSIFAATACACLLVAAYVVHLDSLPNDAAKFAVVALRVIPLFTAIGTLFGRAVVATIIGTILYLAMLGGLAAYAQSTGMPWTFF